MPPTKIYTDETMMELIHHGSAEFPFQYYLDDIAQFVDQRIDWHWHREFEIATVIRGTALCTIGHIKILLHTGDGIFINSGVIHSFESFDGGLMPNVLFSPEFIAPEKGKIYEKFVEPLAASNYSHLVLNQNNPWQGALLSVLKNVYALCEKQPSTWELRVHSFLSSIWSELFLHRGEMVSMENTGISLISQARLKYMKRYIERNFADKLSLEQIAHAAGISKTEALRCFKSCLQTAPITYLNKYRLEHACKLLLQTSLTISEIAEKTGFESAGYFDRLFKREFGITPKEIRKQEKAFFPHPSIERSN